MAADLHSHTVVVQHAVCFYGSDEEWLHSVARRLVAAVENGATLIAIAYPDRDRWLRQAFEESHLDLDAARDDGSVRLLDADEVLAGFMVAGRPDAQAFDDTVGRMVRAASTDGREVVAYGEMVAGLWRSGDVSGALELEGLWNDLLAGEPFSLLCAYPHSIVGNETQAFQAIAATHSDVEGAPARLAARRFTGTPESARDVRMYTAETLRLWQLDRLVDDAMSVVSEMASNAVVHARTDLVVTLSAEDGRLRIGVRDGAGTAPAQRGSPEELRDSGRGLFLVNAIADAWGTERSNGHKTVWAEFGLDADER